MQPSNQIRKFIRSFEGFRDTAYKPLPTDRYTIGYGSTFYSDGSPVQEGDSIDQPTAIDLFNESLDKVADTLRGISPDNVTQNQFDAVVSLAYNIGAHAFITSDTGVQYHLGKNISAKFPLWNRSGGQIVAGLTSRRMKEKEIYDNSNYSV